ncbi:MAG: phosphotransferase [Candidatus Acidiferrales bacterium]
MIPEPKKAAVALALQHAFGVSQFEDVRILTGGLSTALVFRIVVRGNPYVLRVIMRDDAMSDPTRQFACMKVAQDAGLAPKVWYASVEDRTSITDFVEVQPWLENPVPLIAETIRKIHSLPPFPKLLNYFDALDGFVHRFQERKVLPENLTEDLFRLYAELARVYPRNDSDYVSCHNDLKPENLLFDGDQIWLVDWEASFLNDRYLDLAVPANFFLLTEADEETYLRAYFGDPPGEYRRARFFLMRQIAHISYATVFMLLVARSGTPIDPSLDAPHFRDFHQRLLAGQVTLSGDEARVQYAKLHLNEALKNMRTQRFQDALAQVADRHRT